MGRGLRLTRASAFVASALCLCTLASWAGLNEWTTGGPWGGVVGSVAADPTAPGTLIATSYVGIYRSTDGGSHWAHVGDGIPSNYFGCSAVAAGPPVALYVGGIGVYKSTDGGLTWGSASTGLPGGYINWLAASPADGQTLFACPANGGLYVTADGGGTWTATGAGLGTKSVRLPIFLPGDPSVMYAGAGPGGVYKSTDGGATWNPVGPMMASIPVYSLTFDPANSQVLYAGSANYSGSVWKSTDGGATWNTANTGLGSKDVTYVAFLSGKLWAATSAGLYVSSDGAASWTAAGTDLPQAWNGPITGVPYAAQTLFATTYGLGLIRSTDGGSTWAESAEGISSWELFGVRAEPGAPSRLYCIGDPGLPYASDDGGASWTRISTGLSASRRGIRLLAAPSDPQRLYMSTDGNGIFRSADGGSTWSPAGGTPPNHGYGLAVDPTDPSVVYAGGSHKLMKSTDGGSTWSDITGTLPNTWYMEIVVDPTSHQTVYLASQGWGVYKSTDGGVTWAAANNGLSNDVVNALLLDPWTHSTLYAGTSSGGIFRSTDGAATWTAAGVGPQSIIWPDALTADAGAPGTLYALNGHTELFESTDGGSTWTSVNAPGLLKKDSYGVAADRNVKGRIHLSVYGAGVWSLDPCSQMTCAATVPAVAGTGVPAAFSATPSCGETYAAYDWDFGDGSAHSALHSPSHTYATPGARTWSVTVTVGTQASSQSGTVTVVNQPVVTSMKKVAPPFKFVVAGSNLQSGIRVYIDGVEWNSVVWKKSAKIQITGGASLKAAVPKGVVKTFRFVNPDGGEATTTFSW